MSGGLLPNLLCIGAAKCGTTSLHRYLGTHPDIFMAEAKELEFFTGSEANWDRGLGWYEAQFPVDAPIRGESSPGYSVHPLADQVPERIASTLSEVKLLYIVGDPIERIISSWIGNTSSGRETVSLHERISAPGFGDSVYVWRSRYAHQLGRYLEVFQRSDIHVVVKEELAAEPQQTMAAVFRFLGVDDSFTTPELRRVHKRSEDLRRSRSYPSWLAALEPLANVKRRATHWDGRAGALARRALSRPVGRPHLSKEDRQCLAAHLSEDTARFRALTGLRLEAWSL